MASRRIFETFTRDEIERSVLNAKEETRRARKQEFDTAVDYLEADQRSNIEKELRDRFPSSQGTDAGQDIYPVTIPLTSRYIAEAANAYNRSVSRKFVTEEGTETDTTRKQTLQLNRALEEIRYNEIMHRNEQLMLLLGASCVWYQGKRGNLRPVIAQPQNVIPITPEDCAFLDPNDQNDYEGFIVESFWATNDPSVAQARTYSYVQPAQTTVYSGSDPSKIEELIGIFPNPYKWQQTYDTKTGNGLFTSHTEVLPGQMFTWWNRKLPIRGIIPDSDVSLVDANRELNILWSTIFDTIRFQGYGIPVKKVTNKDSAEAKARHGARFPVILGLEEDFNYVNASANYGDTVEALKAFQQMLAIAFRQNPNDFSTDAATAISGFAKNIDSLPKLEAREEHVTRLTYYEQELAAPRIKAVLIEMGRLDSVAQGMRLVTTFDDIQFPLTPTEEAQKMETGNKYGLTTPVKVLSKKESISEEEARERIEANIQVNEELGFVDNESEPEQPAESTETDEEEVLQGGQITAMQAIVESVKKKITPPDSAKAMLELTYGFTPEESARVIDPIEIPEAPEAPEGDGAPGNLPNQPQVPFGNAQDNTSRLRTLVAQRRSENAATDDESSS